MPPRPHRPLPSLTLAAVTLLATVATASSQSPASRVNRIEEAKTIRIAHRMDCGPVSFVNDQQEPAGYTVDLCRLIAPGSNSGSTRR